MTETTESQTSALVTRVEELGVEVASMRRALFSLGSKLAGGPPGLEGYLAWHEDQVSKMPPPLPAWAALRQDGPTLEEWTQAGYSASAYPPPGYAAKGPTAPAPGITLAPGASSSSAPSTQQSQPATSGTAAPSTNGPSSPPSTTSPSTQDPKSGGGTGASDSK